MIIIIIIIILLCQDQNILRRLDNDIKMVCNINVSQLE